MQEGFEMRNFGELFGRRPPANLAPNMGALELLQSYGLHGYVRPGDADHESHVWFYDGAKLAEGGVPRWIENMQTYLGAQGVVVESVRNVGAPDGYRIELNGRNFLIYPYRNYLDWETSVVSSIQIVNHLLGSAGSHERGYLLPDEGPGGLVVFMTSDVFERLAADPRLGAEDSLFDLGDYDHPTRDAAKVFEPVSPPQPDH